MHNTKCSSVRLPRLGEFTLGNIRLVGITLLLAPMQFELVERQITMAGLKDSFINGLSAMYNTEKLVTQGAPELMHGIQSAQAKQVMEQHGQESPQQMQRLEQVFQMAGETPNDIQPDGIIGILKENEKIQSQGYDPATLEAATVAAAQRIQHYEIAGYGTLVSYAKQLGMNDAAQLLGQTLSEEKSADDKLTQVAESMSNPQSAQAA